MKKLCFLILFLFSQMSLAKRVGYLVTSSDPPHLGHVKLAQAAVEQLHLDELIVFVNYDMSAKPNASEFKHRYAMAKIAYFGNDKIKVMNSTQTEIIKSAGYLGVTEYLATLQVPGDILYGIMGNDILVAMKENNKSPIVRGNMKIAIAVRGQFGEEIPNFPGVEMVTVKKNDDRISSSSLKKESNLEILSGQVPVAVLEYMKSNKLFQFSNRCFDKLN